MLTEQSRYSESEKLARSAVEIYRALGYPQEVPLHANALNRVAMTLFAQGQFDEANEVFSMLDVATKDWEEERRARIQLNYPRIFANYYTGKTDLGIKFAQANVERTKKLGEQHFDYAMAQASLGAGLAYGSRFAESRQAFKVAMPILLSRTRTGDFDDATGEASADRRMSSVVEAYLALLANTPDPTGASAAEAFRLGELIRGQSVQKALAASSARIVADNVALSALVRKEQDLEKTITANLGNLNNMLALPPSERDDKVVNSLEAEIAKLRVARSATRNDIERKFPNYADLVAAKPSSVEDVRAALKPSEAFLSVYFGRRSTFRVGGAKDGTGGIRHRARRH